MTGQGRKDEPRVALLIDADNADPALRTWIEGRARAEPNVEGRQTHVGMANARGRKRRTKRSRH